MQGAGTAEKPLLPTTWDEFLESIQVVDAYVSLPNNAIWDMNEINPDGLNEEIEIKAAEIRGNNTTIKNLYFNQFGCFTASRSADITEIHKLNILNFYTSAVRDEYLGIIESGDKPIHFKNSEWSGVVSSGVFVQGHINNFRFTHDGEKSCALTLEFNGTGDMVGGSMISDGNGLRFQHCNIELSGTSTVDNWNLSQYPYFEYCWIRGKSPFKTFTGNGVSTIYDIEIPEDVTMENCDSTCVVNVDKVKGNIVNKSNDTPIIQTTTAQLKSPAYLQNAGFNIIV